MNRPPAPDPGKRSPWQNRPGLASSGCLLVFLILLILGYGGYKVGEAYWRYYQVREQVREALVWAAAGQTKPEHEIVQRVISQVRDADLEVKPRNVRILQTSESLTIVVSWTHDLEFPSYTYPLDFEVKLTEIKRWGRGGLVVK